jgi:prolyl oligopeptidase
MHLRKLVAGALVLLPYVLLSQVQKLVYPETRRSDQSDQYFDVKVDDPYRWLENDTSAEVADWIRRQSAFTEDYLSRIPFRGPVKNRISQLSNYPKHGIPMVSGNRYFFTQNNGLQNQPVIFSQEKGKEAEVFIDPNKLSADGTIAVELMDFSKDDKYVAYSVSESGSDWQTIKVMTTAGKEMSDELKFVKASTAAWKGNGFYYSRYPEPDEATKFSGKNENHQIWYHKAGTPQSSDVLIFKDEKNPLRYYQAQVTDDERYLIIYVYEGTSGIELLYKDLRKPESKPAVLFKGFDNEYSVLGNEGDNLIVKTNEGAPNNCIISINPLLKKRKMLIPEKKSMLEEASATGGFIFCNYLENVSSHIYQYTLKGKLLSTISLPGTYATVTGFNGKRDTKETFFSITSFAYPAVIYKFNIPAKIYAPFFKSELKFKSEDYITEQVFYPSKDGTRIPMFITYKKGMKKEGNNPTLLYAYGGFNINITPAFSASRIVWMDQGGIFAQPSLRGGGEYGESWHKAGMLLNKQNVFDDFIAAAEYLISNKYTSSSKLAVAGGSNGGLLIGAVTNQRPDLFRVAIPAVGVMDMLRYHKFTVGWGWAAEYGTSDSLVSFQNIYKYSPLHNIHPASYPSVLVTTADHDDRVVPAHSFKYIAELQYRQQGSNPVLIRIDVKAGHGAGKPISKVIDEYADVFSFIWHEMGITPALPGVVRN